MGIAITLAVSVTFGMIFGLPEYSLQLAERSVTAYSDVILAIVSGVAGIISFTMGVPTSLVGVMVALALLPPLTACGIFLGAADFARAGGAGLLFLANIICLNLAGVLTFLVQGIQPPDLVGAQAGQGCRPPGRAHLDRAASGPAGRAGAVAALTPLLTTNNAERPPGQGRKVAWRRRTGNQDSSVSRLSLSLRSWKR